MSSNHKNRDVDEDTSDSTGSYPGPDRRNPNQSMADKGITRQIRFDEKGNSILDLRANTPRRRDGDRTIDLLECLDADSLGLELED
jgi:hypothetical protein